MVNNKSAWVMNMAIRIALIVFLSVLALGLINGVDPVTAVVRSGVAFVSFLILGWGASMLWLNADEDEETDTADDVASEETSTGASSTQPAAHTGVGTATGMPVGAMSAPQE